MQTIESIISSTIHNPATWLALFLLGCGSVTVNDLGAPVDATATRPDAAVEDRRPEATNPEAKQAVTDAGQPETQPPFDGGAPLPPCPPEILYYDCPQPRCNCGDR